VRLRPARAGEDAVQAVACVAHAQGREDAVGDPALERFAAGAADDVADQAVGDVLVGVALAGRALHRRVGHLADQRGVLGVALDVAVEAVVAEADAMAQHLGDGQLQRGARLGELQGRVVVDDSAVPAQAALVDQQAGGGGGEGLRQRGQPEHGVFVDGLGVVHVGDAVAARAEDAALVDDRHRQAGHLLAGDEVLGDRFEFGDAEAGRQRHHLQPVAREHARHRRARRVHAAVAEHRAVGEAAVPAQRRLRGDAGGHRQQQRGEPGGQRQQREPSARGARPFRGPQGGPCGVALPGIVFHRICPLRMLRLRVGHGRCRAVACARGSRTRPPFGRAGLSSGRFDAGLRAIIASLPRFA